MGGSSSDDAHTLGFANELSTGGDQWAQCVDTAIALYRVQAFHSVTLELVASESGLSLPAVVRQFPTKEDLVLAVIQVWNARRMEPILPIAQSRGAVAFLRGIVVANVADSALMRLLTATVNIAATPDHPMAPLLQRQWIQFHALVQRALVHDVAVGREPETMEPARGAEQLIAVYEGLQLQSMLRPHMDVVEAYDRAATRLRDGWSTAYAPPVWDI
jgi:AcrR family transcriptional regulator